jgi:hypothetical protein
MYKSFDLKKINAIPMRNIRQTVERASIRCSYKDIIIACIGQGGAKSAEKRLGDTIGKIACLADISPKVRVI